MKKMFTIHKVFLLFIPILIMSFIQPDAFCETQTMFFEESQELDVTVEDDKKDAASSDLIILGAFASLEEPDTDNRTINYEDTFNMCDAFYIGIVIQNNGNDELDKIKVRFKFSGKINGTTDKFFYEIMPGINILSMEDKLPIIGNYTYKIKMYHKGEKIKGQGTIKLKVEGDGDCEEEIASYQTVRE